MVRPALFFMASCSLLAGSASAQVYPTQWKNVNGSDIRNANSGNVGVNVDPLAQFHVKGTSLFENGDLIVDGPNQTIRFSPTNGSNQPMIEMFANGTTNVNRMVIAHGPGHQNWGLQYRDVGDEFHFLSNGNTVLNVDLGNSEVVSAGQTKLQGLATFTGGLSIQSEVNFTNDDDSLTFPASSGANTAMIQMFATGTSNADRMVLAHSPAFPTWGLQYRDSGDEFRFLNNGTTLMNVDLGAMFVGINGELNFEDDLGNITFPASSGSNDAMIHMFSSGTSNADRMVLSHSPAFSDWGLQYSDANDEFRFLGSGTSALTIELSSREVGVGTNSPAVKFQVGAAGDGTSALANAWNIFSSRDYKKDIVELSDEDCADALEKVVATPIFRFHYKEQAEDSPTRVGLIVEESPEEMLASEVKIDGQVKAVDLSRHVSMLHAALKAQQAEIDALKELLRKSQ